MTSKIDTHKRYLWTHGGVQIVVALCWVFYFLGAGFALITSVGSSDNQMLLALGGAFAGFLAVSLFCSIMVAVLATIDTRNLTAELVKRGMARPDLDL